MDVSDSIKTIEEINKSLQHFSWPDYIAFSLMLVVCAFIGIFFGVKQSKMQFTLDNYLMGGRNMQTVPVGMSLIASYISGITLIGFPTEIYLYGMQYSYSAIGLILMGLLTMLYLPVYHELKLTSSYEYLLMRFDKRVRFFGSLLFCIGLMAWLPVVIYVPALAFNQVTGVDVHVITPFVSFICIFYTTLGGMKAVVWTDVVQTVCMFGAMIFIAVKGTINVGGISEVFRRNMEGERIELPDLNLDPTVRHTLWGLIFGMSMHYLQNNAVSQSMIQRYLSLPTLGKANRACWIYIGGSLIMISLCTYCGFLIFAVYHECDPLSTKLAKAKDQVLPLLVIETLGKYPGVSGLFIAGVFSAAMSSLSTGLNSISAVVMLDFYKAFIDHHPSDRVTSIFMRSVVIVTGIICMLLVYVVENLGSILQLSLSLSSLSHGPLLAVISMGMFIPQINTTGAFYGSLIGLGSMAFIGLGAQVYTSKGYMKISSKKVTTAGCKYKFTALNATIEMFNSTSENHVLLSSSSPSTILSQIQNATTSAETVPIIFQISYTWYTLMGMLISTMVAVIITYCFSKPNNPDDIDPKLISPVIRRFLKKRTDDYSLVRLKQEASTTQS